MALSNAVVPILPSLANGTTAQGAIYAGYFLGSFLLTVPAGLLADRTDPVFLIKAGLLITLASGLLLTLPADTVVMSLVRVLEGAGGGIFMSAALTWVNEQTDHTALSGYFMAALNGGLVAGIIVAGLFESPFGARSGIAIFTFFAGVAALLGLTIREGGVPPREWGPFPREGMGTRLMRLVSMYRWIWLSALVLVGSTGAVTAIYPEFSDAQPNALVLPMAAMGIATVAAVLLTPLLRVPPIPAIRVAAIATALSVIGVLITPWALVAIGAAVGVVIISQLEFLSDAEVQQGSVMGIYNAAGYAGMTLLSFFAGILAEGASFLWAFGGTALLCVVVAATIGRCEGCTWSRGYD
jgi:MFS family permease